MHKKTCIIAAFFIVLMICLGIHTSSTVYSNSDFKNFDVEQGGSITRIQDKQYTVLKNSKGIQALGMNPTSNTATIWNVANQQANQYYSQLSEKERSYFTKSELPSYQTFANNRHPSNSALLSDKFKRGTTNWWLYDTQKIQFPYEVNQPGNAIYASRVIGSGNRIENSKGATTVSYKGYNNEITNYHTAGITAANVGIPTSYALNNNYTLGNKAYAYRDTQVKIPSEERPPGTPSHMGSPKYPFLEYDWEYYQNSYNGAIKNDGIKIYTSVSDTGGVNYHFWDLMRYNANSISIVAEINKQTVTKKSDGRLNVNVNKFYSNFKDDANRNITLQGGRQYIAFLPLGYEGRAIENSFVVLDIPNGVTIALKKTGRDFYKKLNDFAANPAILMLTTSGTEFDDSQMNAGDRRLTYGSPKNGNTKILLYDYGKLIYAGPVSNILENGKLALYQNYYHMTHPTRNIPNFGWGLLTFTFESDVDNKNTVSLGRDDNMMYISQPISNPQVSLKAGFYEIKSMSSKDPLQLNFKGRSGSVRWSQENIYARRKNGENVAVPYVRSRSERTITTSPYQMYGKDGGLNAGSYSIMERLPPTNLTGEKAFAYPLLTMNTQKIAYTSNMSSQSTLSPTLRETSNTLKNQSDPQVLYSLTNALSWKSNEIHLLNEENSLNRVSEDGSTVYIQGGTKQVKFKVTGTNDQLAQEHSLYISAASEDKNGKRVYGRVGSMQDGIITMNIDTLMDYQRVGNTKEIRLYIEAITQSDHMNYVSETFLPVTFNITQPNHMTLSFPTYIELVEGKADVNISVVDYKFFTENVPAGFIPKLTSTFQSESTANPNTIKAEDAKGKRDRRLKVHPPEKTSLQGNDVSIGKTFTYKVYGDGTNGSDKLSSGLWKGLFKVKVDMQLYP